MSTQRQYKTPAGIVKVRVSAPGYYHVERRVEMAGNETIVVKLYPRRALQEAMPQPALFAEPRWRPNPSWQPQPALIIGLGGTGRHVLTHLKKSLLDASAGNISEKIRFALIDTGDYELLHGQEMPVSFAGVSLSQEDIVELTDDLNDLQEKIRSDSSSDPYLSSWFPAEEYHRRLGPDELNLANGTRQRRPLARATLVRDLRKGVSLNGVDVVLLLDRSESMVTPFSDSQTGISKLKAAQEAAILFLSQMNPLTDRVAAVAFNENSEILTSLTSQFADVAPKIRGFVAAGATSIQGALKTAAQILAENSGAREKVVILLSDGQGELADSVQAAEALKRGENRVITVGIGDADENLLRAVASSWQGKPDYFYAQDSQTLKQVYLRIARQVGEGSRIWRLLYGGAARAVEAGELRVAVVGSVAGGFGSAVLSDIAYLARRAGKAVGARSISVDAYLVTDGVFSRVSSGQEVLQANTYAALREIERFQLAQGFPFRMEYDREQTANPVLFGNIEWRLLDEIYLFDHLPNIPARNVEQEKGWRQPELSVFPAIADALVFSLDKAARSGSLASYRKQIEGDITREQTARNRAVVGSLGAFRYYFPVRDVFEMLKIRWASKVLRLLLTGTENEDLAIKPSQNQEESEARLDAHVRLFLLGYAGYSEPDCPVALSRIGKVIVEGRTALAELKSAPAPELESETRQFAAYLQAALLVMLNGLKSSNVRAARTGKVGYAFAFLQALKDFLADAESILFNLADYHSLAENYLAVTKQTEEALRQSLLSISHLFDRNHQSPDGLLEHLQKMQAKSAEILQEQESILTRQSILSGADAENWFKEYFSDESAINETLSRLRWQYQDGRFQLTLFAWDEAHLDTHTPKTAFLQELLTLAGRAGERLLQEQNFAAWLEKKLAQPAQADEVARQAMQASVPLIDFREYAATHARYALTFGAPIGDEAKALEDALRREIIAERKLYRLQSTDPYALTFIQTMDIVPLDALPALQEAYQTYARWYGFSGEADLRSESTAVFRAERIALALERRMPRELQQAARVLSPVLVTALDSGLPARLYALAFANGWVQASQNQILLEAPGMQPISVTIPVTENEPQALSPYVLGLIQMVGVFSAEQIQALRGAISQSDMALLRAWTLPNWRELSAVRAVLSTSSTANEDFVLMVALIVREEVMRRVKAGNT